MKKKIFIIDASALIYRSFYAFIRNPLTTKQGEHTSALYGFSSAILRLLNDENPTHIAIVKDLPYPTFRHEKYSLYKAQRKPMPDDLKCQIPLIDEFIALTQLPVFSKKGFESR